MAVHLKGLRDIRTHAGTIEKAVQPHKLYMQITCLEMEKARRGKERASALRRVADVDARFKEIEAEKDRLVQALGEHASKTRASGDAATVGRRIVSRRNNGGYTFKY